MNEPRLYIITGAMAAGKSTVAEALARRFPKAVHLRGDVFRKMIVSGGAEIGPQLDREARLQLTLRQDIACAAARSYWAAGFTVVYQDIIIGPDLGRVAELLADLHPRIVVLNPAVDVLAERDRTRRKTGYGPGFAPARLAGVLATETPRLGLWLDTSEMTVDEAVDRAIAEA